MIRPEARSQLMRYREALIGGAFMLFGLWWALTSLGLFKWTGILLVLLGGAFAWQGFLRAGIKRGAGGVGVVQVDERQITYLAPIGGGFSSLDLVQEITVARDRAGLPVWRFRTGSEILTIPTSAQDSEQLFDALTVLDGIDIPHAIRSVNTPPDHSVVIWSRKVVPLY